MDIPDERKGIGDGKLKLLFITVLVSVVVTALVSEVFPGLSAAAKLVGYLALIIGITLVLGFIGGYFIAYDLTVMSNTPADVESHWEKISNKFSPVSISHLTDVWFPPLWLRRKVKEKKIVCVSTKKESLEYLKRKLPYVFKDSEIKKRSKLAYLAWVLLGRRLTSYRDLFYQKLAAYGVQKELNDIADRLKPRLKKSFGKSVELEHGENKNEIWLNMTRHAELAPFKYKVVFDKPSDDEVPSTHLSLHYSGPPLKEDWIGNKDVVQKDFNKLLKVVEKVAKDRNVETERDTYGRVILTHSIMFRKNEHCLEIRSIGRIPEEKIAR